MIRAEFLITDKRVGEHTVFELLREGERRTLDLILTPLPPLFPRTHGVDATPSWLLIGGLLFCPLTCPLIEISDGTMPGTADLQRGYGRAAFRKEEDGKEALVLEDIFRCDLNFGYNDDNDSAYHEELLSLNGVEVQNIAQLYRQYMLYCQQYLHPEQHQTKAPEYLEFEFKMGDRLVLELSGCIEAEEEVLTVNAIPGIVAEHIREAAEAATS